jgi:hypothetical protein
MKSALAFLISLSICAGIVTCARYAVADGSGSALAEGSAAGSASAPPAATPADELHDPIAAPAQAWDDVKAAKKVGWAVLVFAVLTMMAKLAGRMKTVKFFAPLGKGKVAVVIGALGALGASCYNAAAEGGAWTAMLVAGVTAIAHYMNAEKSTG